MRALVQLVGGSELHLDQRESAEELAADLHRAAGVPQQSDDGTVVTFLDKELMLTRPAVLRRVARNVGTLVPPAVDRLAASSGLPLVLGAAVSLEIGVPLVVVDGEEVRGTWYPGERAVLVEDVTLSGASAHRSVRSLRRAGLTVTEAVAAVDRDEGATALLAADGIDLQAVFRLPMGG